MAAELKATLEGTAKNPIGHDRSSALNGFSHQPFVALRSLHPERTRTALLVLESGIDVWARYE